MNLPRTPLRAVVSCTLLFLSGCATSVGSKWYAPTTWFSHAPADQVDRTTAQVVGAQDAAIKAAQKSAHAAQNALQSAAESRPVAVARTATDNTVALLDQAAGPLPAADLAAIRQQIADLLSENASVRAAAEQRERANQSSIAEISQRLASAEEKARSAATELRSAFDRENALANQLRSQRALLWIAGAGALLCALGWAYVKFALGGLPLAAGKFMREIRVKYPDFADKAEPIFDSYLNRREQAAVAKHAA